MEQTYIEFTQKRKAKYRPLWADLLVNCAVLAAFAAMWLFCYLATGA